MDLHADAKSTQALRRLLVHRVQDLGWKVSNAAEAAGIGRQIILDSFAARRHYSAHCLKRPWPQRPSAR